MADDDQKHRLNVAPQSPDGRRPWERPRLIPLDVASTEGGGPGGFEGDGGEQSDAVSVS